MKWRCALSRKSRIRVPAFWKRNRNCFSGWEHSCLHRPTIGMPLIILPVLCSWASIIRRPRPMPIIGAENRNTVWSVIRRLPMTCGCIWSLLPTRIHRNTDWLFTVWDTVCSSRNNIIPPATGLSAVCRTDGRRRLL